LKIPFSLDGVHFTSRKGKIHALMGENGAGKSTFIKIITDVHLPDRGDFLVDGKLANVRTPLDAQALGIAAIYSITNDLAAAGYGIIMVPSEMPEVLGMSDRVVVMRKGVVTAVMDTAEATQETILKVAMGE
jgi:ABC-type sugar transport system ATPase subunit